MYSAACGVNQPNLLRGSCQHWGKTCQHLCNADVFQGMLEMGVPYMFTICDIEHTYRSLR